MTNTAFWDRRASLGEQAGTQDLIAREFEQRAVLRAVAEMTPVPSLALEIGCGRGETAALVAGSGIQVLGIDTAQAMIQQAQAQAWHGATFQHGTIDTLPPGQWPLIYTQRCIINQPTWEEQRAMIDAIAARLAPHGRYLMCEASQDGLDAINEARSHLGRCAITPPWHNRYLRQAELDTVTSLRLVRVEPFSATYYFLSRVLNDRLSADMGLAPSYDAAINRLALNLPLDCAAPRFAQGQLFVWEKP